jgi:hypothetical protein
MVAARVLPRILAPDGVYPLTISSIQNTKTRKSGAPLAPSQQSAEPRR